MFFSQTKRKTFDWCSTIGLNDYQKPSVIQIGELVTPKLACYILILNKETSGNFFLIYYSALYQKIILKKISLTAFLKA